MRHRFNSTFHIREGYQQADRNLGQGDQLQHGFADDGEGALGADDQILQTVAGAVLSYGGTEGLNLAVGEHHGQGADIVPGDTIFYGTHTASIGGDIAADGGTLFAGIRRIKKVIFFCKGCQLHQQHTGLNGNRQIIGVQLQNLVHFGGFKQDAAMDGHCRTNQAGAAAPDSHGDRTLPGMAHNGGDFFSGMYPNQNFRHAGNAAQFVMGIIGIDGIAHQHIGLPDDFLQSGDVRHSYLIIHQDTPLIFSISLGTIRFTSPTTQ